MLYRLGQHEDARRRVVAEIQAAFQGDDLDPATLASCHTLQGAIKETMRLHPISPGQLRTVKAPVRLNGYQLMPGEHLIIAHAAAHFLENAYVDPERFDLDRHAPAKRDEQVPGAYAPFGIGPHTCLGAGTANLLLAANVAALLHRYEISLYPSNYRLRVSNLELPKPVGLRVVVTPRSKFRALPSSGGAAL